MRVQTDTATVPDDPAVRTTEPAKDKTKELAEALDTASAEATCDTETTPSATSDHDQDSDGISRTKTKRRINWSQLVAYRILPGLALLLAVAAGFLKWQDSSVRESEVARIESVAAAKDSTIALLSYKPDSVEKDLGAAGQRLTGTFKESYTQLTHDVVIPGAKQKHISAVATVPAAASVSATPNHAVALVFVNQTAAVGTDAPTETASSVRVTLDKIDGRWLMSGFDPV
ncbi:MAG: Mce-associated rane protein [Mycobacterium sp.]|nr:Mce-associated rane protein [Mycobacterium sp.]